MLEIIIDCADDSDNAMDYVEDSQSESFIQTSLLTGLCLHAL